MIENQTKVPDPEGIEMASQADAKAQAATALAEYLMERMQHSPTERGPLSVAIVVREDDGPLVTVGATFVIEELQ